MVARPDHYNILIIRRAHFFRSVFSRGAFHLYFVLINAVFGFS